ncbi:hypothetical protein M0G43_07375 [Subsaxibacter sp. CAU 1640]|uniref:hypothetical protein n=1 Tax=Subsaxibacter sp. CAU 1640 TaxID=2933271 RepID=UPI00200644F6|nr:hypothetical protein [Subsaxibacter sp. CAU 1640]MCK7590387.1 hypothetical protein [Subsaxibacter sp. CAU 1640]
MNKIIWLLIFSVVCLKINSQEIKQNDSNKIIEQELLRYSLLYEKGKVYLDFTLNDYLIDFIKKNETDSTKINYGLVRWLNDEQIYSIFNKKEVNYLIDCLNKNRNPKNFSLPENVHMYSETHSSTIDELEKRRIVLSSPAITRDNNYALISYAYGAENAMQGGVNVYVSNGTSWKFYKSIHLTIE